MVYYTGMGRRSAAAFAYTLVGLCSLLFLVTTPAAGAAVRSHRDALREAPRFHRETVRGGAPPAPPPAPASARLDVTDAFTLGDQTVTIPTRPVVLQGLITPYVAGQAVTLRATLNGRAIETMHLSPTPSRYHAHGTFRAVISSPAPGTVTVTATHTATAAQAAFTTSRGLLVLAEKTAPGSTGPFVRLIQQRLAALHFYLRQTGVLDAGTGLALDAYHRLLRWGVSQTLDSRTITYLLNGRGVFKVGFAHQGRHAEANLSDQLVALIDGSQVQMIVPTSSGKPSTPTVLGQFRIYYRDPKLEPDGMVYSSYFYRGYAIHGYNPAPDYPASHGCLRVPIPDAKAVYEWLTDGDWVDVYYRR